MDVLGADIVFLCSHPSNVIWDRFRMVGLGPCFQIEESSLMLAAAWLQYVAWTKLGMQRTFTLELTRAVERQGDNPVIPSRATPLLTPGTQCSGNTRQFHASIPRIWPSRLSCG